MERDSGTVSGRFLASYTFFLFMAVLVMAAGPTWVGDGIIYSAPEDTEYYHNLSANISVSNGTVTFDIDTENSITWTNASGTFNVTASAVSAWMRINNETTGNFTINATDDSQTGFFVIPFQASDLGGASVTFFEFMINASNDVPNVTVFETEYNLTVGQSFSEYVNASDEESHFPLTFNLSFVNNCTHASWTGRNSGENCSLFNASSTGNTSALINYTAVDNDVGTYWGLLSAYDSGEQYTCPHAYCVNATYQANQTSSTSLVVFNILSTLTINASNCTGQLLTEDAAFSCLVSVRTKQANDEFNLSSYASFENGYGGPIANRSWFYANNTLTATNFSSTINISLTPTKREVGNWTINLSAVSTGLSDLEEITLFVNWSEENVTLASIANMTLYENATFLVNATDADLLIQDKLTKNENLTFASNTSWVSITSTETISGTNYTTATVLVNYDAISSAGDANYTVILNVSETGGSYDEQLFTIQIINDTRVTWNTTKSNVSVSNESDSVYINLSEYVFDAEGDPITFSYVNDTPFDSFNLTSTGIINFSSVDADVGAHTITFNASDGKLDSFHSFNFTIYNEFDNVSMETLPSTVTTTEDNNTAISLNVYDDDFLIPDVQSSFYNETLDVNVTFENLTYVVSPITFNFTLVVRSGNLSTYLANFTPNNSHSGVYNVSVNVTDASGLSDINYFVLNISSQNDAPNLSGVSNQTAFAGGVFYMDINATDEEDSPTLPENGNLSFEIQNLTSNGNFLTINRTSGVINASLNSSHVGTWDFNVSVNDTDGLTSSEIFSLTVYGAPSISTPTSGTIFNWSEGNSTGNISFGVNYGVDNTILTYKIYMDKIEYSNATSYNYTTLFNTSSLRNQTNVTWSSGVNFTWNYTLGYAEESYGLLKNLSLVVYNPDYPDLNDTAVWSVNISHVNQNISFSGTISDKGPATAGSPIEINLSEYFEDADYWDKKIAQNVSFEVSTVSGAGYIKPASSINSNWILSLDSPVATTETIQIIGYEYNSSNNTIGNATSNAFEVVFTDPTTTNTPSSGGGGGGSGQKTVLQHFSIKVIVPQKVEISDKNYIDIGFTVRNSGQTNLNGIELSSLVTYEGRFSEDINISLDQSSIPSLGVGESQDFSMRIFADTSRSGRYKATVFANVTSPKFSDWGDFFIDLNKVNDSEASQLLTFTEELVLENPECVELTENLDGARDLYLQEEYEAFKEVAASIVEACEDAISANEQIRYPLSFAGDNFYYISFSTLVIFFMGFIFYVYKRVRFNKYRVDEYIGGEYV